MFILTKLYYYLPVFVVFNSDSRIFTYSTLAALQLNK